MRNFNILLVFIENRNLLKPHSWFFGDLMPSVDANPTCNANVGLDVSSFVGLAPSKLLD